MVTIALYIHSSIFLVMVNFTSTCENWGVFIFFIDQIRYTLVLNLWIVHLHSIELSSAKETHVGRLQAGKPKPRRRRGGTWPSRIPISTNRKMHSESPSTSRMTSSIPIHRRHAVGFGLFLM